MSRTSKSTRSFWARLAVNYYRDEKILKVGPLAELAFVRLLALARESVESSRTAGGVARILAERELHDLAPVEAKLNGGTLGDILDRLEEAGLIRTEGDDIIVVAYSEWQTTQEEIEGVREATRLRQQSLRDRRKLEAGEDPTNETEEAPSTTHSTRRRKKGEGNDMGVYDDKVEPFEDLRATGDVKKGRTKVGKHGLDPKYAKDVELVVAHFSNVRKKLIGEGFRVTDVWYGDTQRLLKGSSDAPGLTVDQVCDLIDFALSHHFWHAHTQTPAGLVRHGMKLYGSDDYIVWSKRNSRPEANRPRNNLAGGGKPNKGALPADQKVDWGKESETF